MADDNDDDPARAGGRAGGQAAGGRAFSDVPIIVLEECALRRKLQFVEGVVLREQKSSLSKISV